MDDYSYRTVRLARPAALTLSALLMLGAVGHAAAAVSFSVTPERTRTTLDQPIRVQGAVVADKDLGNLPMPAVPASDAFQIVTSTRNQSSSSSISITNGRAERKVEITTYFTWVIAPKQLGSFTFPALSLSVEGQNYASQPFTVEVLKEAVQSADVVVRLRCSKTRLYVGEQASLTVVLGQKPNASVQLTNEGFGALMQSVRTAAGQDFSLVDLSRGKVAAVEDVIDGERYAVYKVQLALIPLNPGQLALKPIPLQYNILRRSRSRDPFDDFFGGSFFGNVQAQAATAMSNSLTVTALALPPPPANFSGVVGKATLSVDVDPREVSAGGAVTLKVNLRAETRPGNVGELTLPQTPAFETFTPEKNTVADTTAEGIVTRRTYKYLLIARQEGSTSVPPLSFVYFDPVAGQYRTLSSEAFPITVTKGTGTEKPATRYLSQAEIREVGNDIRYIKAPPHLNGQSARPYRGPLFYLLNLIPVLVMLFSLLYRLQRSREAADPTLLVRRRAYNLALRRLADLGRRPQALTPANFLAALSAALEDYITQTFVFAAAGKTTEELTAALAEFGADESVRAGLRELSSRLDALRFGGLALDHSACIGVLAQTRALVSSLEAVKKGAKK
jgi:hypothetical protein